MTNTIPYLACLETYAKERAHLQDLADQILDMAMRLPSTDDPRINREAVKLMQRARLMLTSALDTINEITF